MEKDILGAYGFQMMGASSISGSPSPAVSIGRLAFEGAGKISGYSSVNFNGWFLGNPVTGSYELKSDCGLTWKLQDDSGGFQHFTGKFSVAAGRVDFRQAGGEGVAGVMKRTPASCNNASFRGRYTFTATGISTPFAEEPLKVASDAAIAEADGAGQLTLIHPKGRTEGSYSLEADCFMEVQLTLPAQNGGAERLLKLRGILVDGGREALAMETEPRHVGAVKFKAL